MAKLGFDIPTEIDTRLRSVIPWGRKQKIIIGLLLLMLDDQALYVRALNRYHKWRNNLLHK